MKLLLCATLLAVAVTVQGLTDEQKAKWQKWSTECRTATGVSQETIEKIRNNQFDVDDDKVKAHGFCFGKKSGLVNSAGDIDVDQVRARLKNVVDNDAEIERIINQCVVKKGTQEESAFETFKCLRKERPNFSPV